MVHPRYGRGEVIRVRHKGFELQVAFERGLTLWVRRDEVQNSVLLPPFAVGDRVRHPVFGEGRVVSITPCTYSGKKTFVIKVHFDEVGLKELLQDVERLDKVKVESTIDADEKFKYRRMIEAFRLGIVPYDCVEDFTYGRDEEIKQISEWLECSGENVMLVIGEYGAGKTHLLHYAIGRAIYNNFAVAWVEMDPNEAPFHKPKRVYNHLIQNFRYYDSQTGQLKRFRDFLKQVLADGAFEDDHLYFKCLVGRDEEIFWEWIEGTESIPKPEEWIENPKGYRVNKYSFLPGLYDYSTAANIYCYLLSGLGWAARTVLGLSGLLLVFDEAESIALSYYSHQAEKGRNFLKSLVRTARDDEALMELPILQSDLDYCRQGAGPITPFLYKIPSGLKLLFAFTSLDWNEIRLRTVDKVSYIEEFDEVPQLFLERLPERSLQNLFEQVYLLYNKAYDFSGKGVDNKVFHQVISRVEQTRLLVKGFVEALDLARLSQ